jgi:hypothetical protein
MVNIAVRFGTVVSAGRSCVFSAVKFLVFLENSLRATYARPYAPTYWLRMLFKICAAS